MVYYISGSVNKFRGKSLYLSMIFGTCLKIRPDNNTSSASTGGSVVELVSMKCQKIGYITENITRSILLASLFAYAVLLERGSMKRTGRHIHRTDVFPIALQWRHNEHDDVSNHQPYDWLLNRLSSADQRKYQSSASLPFVRGIHLWPVNSPHERPVTRKMFPFPSCACVKIVTCIHREHIARELMLNYIAHSSHFLSRCWDISETLGNVDARETLFKIPIITLMKMV